MKNKITSINQEKNQNKKPEKIDFALQLADKAFLYVKNIDESQKIASEIIAVRNSNEKLMQCTEKSIIQCMRDALTLGLTVNKNNFCWLVAYGSQATLQIGYKGYIHKIKKIFSDTTFNVGLIYEGDEFIVSENEQVGAKYTLNRKDPFAKDNLKGVYCYIKINNRGYLEIMNKQELDLVRSKNQAEKYGKESAWSEWYGEMAKKTVIKRACKIHFAQEIKDLEEYDNKQYNLQSKVIGLEELNNNGENNE